MFAVSNITNDGETATQWQALLQCLSFFLHMAVPVPPQGVLMYLNIPLGVGQRDRQEPFFFSCLF